MEIVLLVLLALHLSGLVAVAVTMRVRRRPRAGTVFEPFVAVLKPLKGLDDGIEQNLESFFGLEYGDHEILFGVEDPADPVIPVVRRLMVRHPEVRARLLVGRQDPGTVNPKVRCLLRLLDETRAGFVVVSDSNVRVAPGYLRHALAPMRDPRVGLVTHVVAGVGETSSGSILEHMHLDGWIAMIQSWCATWIRLTPVIGKSMVIRLGALTDAGGLEGLGGFLAEDYLLGRRMARRGWRTVLSGRPVSNWNERTTVIAFLDRHYRWLGMRWRINPLSCLLELMAIPTLWIAIWVVLDPARTIPALGFLLAFALIERITCQAVRGGRPMPVRALALKPLKDVLHAMVIVASLFNHRVNWRGAVYRLGWMSRITRLPARESRNLPPFLFSMRMGDEWPFAGSHAPAWRADAGSDGLEG